MSQAISNSSHMPNSRNSDTASRLKHRFLAGLLALILGGHLWLTFNLFPSWQALVNDQPVISVDHAIHLYHGYLGAKFLKEHGTSWGYDPYFMAGYPKTPVYDSSSGPAELFQLAIPGSYSPRAYKIGIALLIALVPVAIGLAGWGYEMTLPKLVCVLCCTVWFWWVGFADMLTRTGLVAFVWASALAVLVPGLFMRWATERGWTSWLALAVATALGIQAHSIFPLMVVAPLLLGYAWFTVRGGNRIGQPKTRPDWRWHAATWASLALALLATSFWWWPLIKFLPLKTASDLFMTYRGNPLDPLTKRVAALLLDYYLLRDALIPLLLVFFGLIGLVRWCVIGRGVLAVMLGTQVAVLALLTFGGSEWQVTRHLEPLRFQVPLGLTLCLPAGEGIFFLGATALGFMVSRGSKPRAGSGIPNQRRADAPHSPAYSVRLPIVWRVMIERVGAALSIGLAILITFPSLWWARIGLNPTIRPPSTWQSTIALIRNARPLAVGLRPEMMELVAWIRQNTDNSARILFEDQLRLLEGRDPSAPESLHWTPLLPLLTDRQFVGGLYHLAFIPQQRAAFGDWNLAGRNIREWSADELWALLEQYNIGWVITWSRASPLKQGSNYLRPLSTDIFAHLEFCEPVATIRRHTTRPDEAEYTIFRVVRKPNYFAKGRGRVVRADYNRIELADLEPEQGELVLRYHWQDQFTADPPARLRRSEEPGDPVGFIRILIAEPMDRLTVRNAYRSDDGPGAIRK
jgi:hypothetical protein